MDDLKQDPHRHEKHRHHHDRDENLSPDEVVQRVENRVRWKLLHHGLRDQVVMARVGQEVVDRLDALVEAGIFQSRSEAAAILLRDAIQAREKLFSTISAKITEISSLKENLREKVRREFFPEPNADKAGK